MQWAPPVRRELSDDILDCLESNPSETAELLKRFKPGEYWEKPFQVPRGKDSNYTGPIMAYIEQLQQSGLDIGKGDCEFGYKMPIPQKGASQRVLQVFRRR